MYVLWRTTSSPVLLVEELEGTERERGAEVEVKLIRALCEL